MEKSHLLRKLMALLLAKVGFVFKETENGREAIELFENWEHHPILMDMQMTVLNGYKATQYIKKTEKEKTVPVIAVTASAFDEDRAQIMAFGADAYLHKPFRADELVKEKMRYIEEAHISTILAMVKLTEYRDSDTGQHIDRTPIICKVLAEKIREHSHYKKMNLYQG